MDTLIMLIFYAYVGGVIDQAAECIGYMKVGEIAERYIYSNKVRKNNKHVELN